MASEIQNLDGVSPYNQKVLIGAGVTLTVLPIITVALRFYARYRSRVRVGLDDWVILVALVLCTAGGIVELLAATIGGMGEHQKLGPNGELIHYPALTNYEKTRYANEAITTPNLGIIKISILLFYQRLFSVRTFKLASNIVIGVVVAWTIAFTSTMLAQCTPPHLFWDRFEIDYGTDCINVQMFYQALAYSDLFLDVVVLVLPIPTILKLQMDWRKKIAVLDVLLLGLVVLGSGIARLVSFQQVINQTADNPKGFFFDTLWWTSGPLFWVFAENSVAIIGACLPTLAPLWNRASTNRSPASSYFKKISNGSNGRQYDPQRTDLAMGGLDQTSVSHLVTGPATEIHADTIPLEHRPPAAEGIVVQQSFGSNRD